MAVGGSDTFGVSVAGLGLIWHTPLMVFACVAYRMFCNMGCWDADMATTIVIPTGARGEFARMMVMLKRFLFKGAHKIKPEPPDPDDDKPPPDYWWLSLIFAASARLLAFGMIPTLAACGGDAGMIARRARALYLIEKMNECEGISVRFFADGSFFISFQPNTGIAALTGFWPTAPRSVGELGQIGGVDLAHPDLMNQIPAYSHPRDATTGARPGNRVGSWRRSQLRLEADACVPKRPDQI